MESSNPSIQHIILAGNPNCGKTSLFNILAGLNQKVSNVPGTTVEKVMGSMRVSEQTYTLTDLPGAYSLLPKSEDELVAAQELLNARSACIVFVADATRLDHNLYYFSQIADLGLPMVLVLNMTDLAKKKGIEIQEEVLSQELGVLVVSTSAREQQGVQKLKTAISKATQASQRIFLGSDPKSNPAEQVAQYKTWLQRQLESFRSEGVLLTEGRKEDAAHRQTQLQAILNKAQKRGAVGTHTESRWSAMLAHPVYGTFILMGILFVIFQAVFALAEWPMQGIEWLFAEAGSMVRNLLPEGWLNNLLVEGIISGLAGIVVFLPQILILFFFIGIMEETGYITRVSFLTDRFMRIFGLNGKSVIPMAGGLACAIPSVMAARSIENKAEKLATILITPLMTCSARLPVYTLLISLMVPQGSTWGPFNVQGLVLMGMYLLGFVAALLFSLVFRLFIQSEVSNFFVLEIPELRPPRWKALWVTLYRKGMTFLTGAGKVILIVSLILFFLKSYGPGNEMALAEQRVLDHWGPELSAEQALILESEVLKASYAGKLGQWIEPVIRPLGYDWKIGIALITSFAAREVFVGTMSVIYGVADDDEGVGLREKLRSETDPETGKPIYSFAVLCSLLIFYAFALQCMSTVAIVYRETHSIKWTLIQLFSMTGVAWILSAVTYTILA